MLYLQIHLPVVQLRVVLHPVFRTLHGERAYASRLTALRQLILPQRHTPGFNALVHLLLVLEASSERGELRRGGPSWIAHHLNQALPLLIRMADNHTPIIVIPGMSAISIVGRDHRTTVIVDQGCVRPMGAIAGGKASAARCPPVHG